MSQILCGDCVEMMRDIIKPESIGLIITSPPYNVGLNYDGYNDRMSDEDFINFNRRWLEQAYIVMKQSARMYVVISDKMLFWFKDLGESVGFTFAQKLVWCKPNFVGAAGKVSNDWNYMTEDILLFRKGKRTPMQNGETTTHNWFVETVPQSNFKEGRIHPAQMPVSLCLRLIDRTPGAPVLDPFCGSGSVLVAAKKLGREYIGIDIVHSTAEAARNRLETVSRKDKYDNLPMFA